MTTAHFVSLGIHTLPWVVPLLFTFFLPDLSFKEQEGELVVPIDMVDDPDPSAPAPTATGGAPGDQPGLGRGDAAADARRDRPDGESSDAAPLAEIEGGIAYLDPDGGQDGGLGFDPAAQLGDLGKIAAGANNVTITINFAVIRTHPLGPRVQPILLAIPEWREFMSGSTIDPYRDTDWMMLAGPSLLDTTKDVVYVHYSASDAEIDKGIAQVSAKYSQGGPMDVGVPGVKAWRAHVHGAERAFLRGQSHCVLIVPYANAKVFAQAAARNPCTLRSPPGEAVRARFLKPGGSVPQIPQSISELRIWLVPRNSDSGADLYAEGDCPDSAAATQAADDLKRTMAQANGLMVKVATAGVLNGFDARADGSMVKIHVPGNKDQVEAFIGLAGARVGVAPPATSGP
jgi:hypothetical protein